MRTGKLLILLIIVLISLSLNIPLSAAQTTTDPYAVIAAVNAFRTSQGLPALEINNSLMAAAQAQSDYQARIRTVTHKGAGGTGAKDRAIAHGFGGGATVFVSENIAGGISMSIEDAIYKYWQDDLHLRTMLNPASVYIGAGVATVPEDNYVYVYYTVVTGYIAGQAGSGSDPAYTPPAPAATAAPTSTPGPTAVPFIVSTPRSDGAIIHVVGYGQSLIGIANTYDIPVAEVLELNGMTMDDVIYPGDEIIIKPSGTPAPTKAAPTTAPSSTPIRTATPRESSTAQPTWTPANTATPSITASPTPVIISSEKEPVVVGSVFFSLAVLIGVIILGLIKRN